jgi:hypothetical protein
MWTPTSYAWGLGRQHAYGGWRSAHFEQAFCDDGGRTWEVHPDPLDRLLEGLRKSGLAA